VTQLVIGASGCTGQIPNSFRLAQQDEVFSTNSQFNSRLDILWVIDNSGSMSNEQTKIRNGFAGFANTYMKSTWDIRLAVITSDTFLAHPTFTNDRSSIIGSSSGFTSNYINGIAASGNPGRANPTSNPNPAWGTLFNWDVATSKWKTLAGGLTFQQTRPNYSSNWARLLDVDPATGKGNHDGQPVSVCFERAPSSFPISLGGIADCSIRDNVYRVSPSANFGPSRCVTPGSGESNETQCVNAGMNDTSHSGKSIINTFGANTAQLIDDFMTNATVGIHGSGVEAGISSVLQLLDDNEAVGSTTKFFRPNALRVIIFVSDEEDQSISYGSGQSTPNSYYASGGPCTKTVDGFTYTIARCADPAQIFPAAGAAIPTAFVKNRLDTFFQGLDGNPAGDPNYFVATITALTAATVQSSGDQATRDLMLGQLVGNGSLELEIESSDYSPLLDAIGQVIVSKKAVFVLARAPTGQEDMIIKIRRADGSEIIVRNNQYTISGKILTITDSALVLSFTATDSLLVNYQPKTLF